MIVIILRLIGAWLRPVERTVRVREVGRSNRPAPTKAVLPRPTRGRVFCFRGGHPSGTANLHGLNNWRNQPNQLNHRRSDESTLFTGEWFLESNLRKTPLHTL